MTIWTDRGFQSRVKQALVKARDFIEVDAECLRESCTNPNHDGEWDSEDSRVEYQREMKQVDEMADLLNLISEE